MFLEVTFEKNPLNSEINVELPWVEEALVVERLLNGTHSPI